MQVLYLKGPSALPASVRSLMAGSELSSPQPSVTSSAKGGRSLKNLFGGKK